MRPLPIVWDPGYSPDFPESHRFPMSKFSYLKEWIDAYVTGTNLTIPEPVDQINIEIAHCPQYIEAFQTGLLDDRRLREIGLPWSQGLANRTRLALGGSITTCYLALDQGLASHLAGGTHHAHFDRGSGFCIYNDLAVCARLLIRDGHASRVLIFDCDVHQGDGTASILREDVSIFTCSIHAAKNFPARKVVSDLDVECPDGMTDEAYLKIVFDTLESVLISWRPDFVIYDAGSDVHKEDALGRLSITSDGLFQRDIRVIRRIRELGIPCATVIGGGYHSDRKRLAARHGIVVAAAATVHHEFT